MRRPLLIALLIILLGIIFLIATMMVRYMEDSLEKVQDALQKEVAIHQPHTVESWDNLANIVSGADSLSEAAKQELQDTLYQMQGHMVDLLALVEHHLRYMTDSLIQIDKKADTLLNIEAREQNALYWLGDDPAAHEGYGNGHAFPLRQALIRLEGHTQHWQAYFTANHHFTLVDTAMIWQSHRESPLSDPYWALAHFGGTAIQSLEFLETLRIDLKQQMGQMTTAIYVHFGE